MSNPANDTQTITAAEFDNLLKEETYQKWSDLEINKIYTVTNKRMVACPPIWNVYGFDPTR